MKGGGGVEKREDTTIKGILKQRDMKKAKDEEQKRLIEELAKKENCKKVRRGAVFP